MLYLLALSNREREPPRMIRNRGRRDFCVKEKKWKSRDWNDLTNDRK